MSKLKAALDRIAELELALKEVTEIYAGMEGFVTHSAPEAYQERALRKMYLEAIKGLGY